MRKGSQEDEVEWDWHCSLTLLLFLRCSLKCFLVFVGILSLKKRLPAVSCNKALFMLSLFYLFFASFAAVAYFVPSFLCAPDTPNWAWPAYQRHGNMTPSNEVVAIAVFSSLPVLGSTGGYHSRECQLFVFGDSGPCVEVDKHPLVSNVASKLNVFGFWTACETKQPFLMCHYGFLGYCNYYIVDQRINGEHNR